MHLPADEIKSMNLSCYRKYLKDTSLVKNFADAEIQTHYL